MKALKIFEKLDFERGMDPKRSMGIGNLWQFKKSRKSHYYEHWTEFYLYKNGELYAEGSTQELVRENTREQNLIENPNYYRTSGEFLKSYGLNIKNVEIVNESIDFQRGIDPKKSMDIGMEHKYGRMYNLFIICHNLSLSSDAFEEVSDIIQEEGKDPYFVIESLFYYTDEDNAKIPEQFVITLYPDELLVYNAITKDEDYIKSARRFMEITSAYEDETATELAMQFEKF